MLGPIVDLPERSREVRALKLAEGVSHEDGLHELLGHPDVEKRAGLFPFAHFDQALVLVERDVRKRADWDQERGILAPLGGGDHRVGHTDELPLDRAAFRSLRLRHGNCYLLFRVARFLGLSAAFLAVVLR